MAFRASSGTRAEYVKQALDCRCGCFALQRQILVEKCLFSCAEIYPCASLISQPTSEVVVLLTVSVGEGHQFPEQQGVLENPLHWFNQVGFQGGRVLLGGVPQIQELLEGLICLG